MTYETAPSINCAGDRHFVYQSIHNYYLKLFYMLAPWYISIINKQLSNTRISTICIPSKSSAR